MAKDTKADELVFPGTFLSAEEEFSPGRNTFESDGSVNSARVGKGHFDNSTREASVNGAFPAVEPLDVGSVVYGIVAAVKEKAAVIEMRNAEHNGENRVIMIASASLPVFDIAEGYVERVSDMYRIGDIVKAEASKVTPYAVDLSTRSPKYGVVKAFCIKCRQPMRLFERALKCRACGHTEQRKIAEDYWLK